MMKGNVRRAEEVVPQGQPEPVPALRIDIGCGKTKMDGWFGIDAIDFGQACVGDLSCAPWRFAIAKGLSVPAQMDSRSPGTWLLCDNSVDEARSSHFVEHLTGEQRIAFFNELHRVLKPGAQAMIVTPNWSHACAYGDPTHQWPPMSEWYPLYLNRVWREQNAPHVGYSCYFDFTTVFSIDPGNEAVVGRSQEVMARMARNNTNVWRDLIVTLTKR